MQQSRDDLGLSQDRDSFACGAVRSFVSDAAEQENNMNDQTIETYEVRRIGEISVDGHTCNLWIDEPYRPGLRGLAEFSHVIITWWAHEAPDQEPADTLIAHEARQSVPDGSALPLRTG